MKLVIFTLDSIFALIIAVSGIALLSYFFYLPQTSTILSYSSAASTLQSLLSTSTIDLAFSSTIGSNLTSVANASSETWDQFMNDAFFNGGNPHGPRSPNVAFIANVPTSSFASRAAIDYGRMYFIVGNTLYCINATNGNRIWSKNIVGNEASAPIIASGMLIYANRTNLTAINPITNTLIWTTNSVAAFAQPVAYNNKVYQVQGLAQTNIVSAYYINNGTLAWTYATAAGGGNGAYLAIDAGSIVVVTSGATSTVALLNDFGSSANAIWSSAIAQNVYGLTISKANNIMGFIGASTANALNIDGTLATGFPYAITSQSFGYPTTYKNVIYYQSSNAVTAIAINGVALWTYTSPAAYGIAVSGDQPGKSSMPVVSDKDVYTTWSNGYLVALNTTSGQIDWLTRAPNAGSFYIDALAYGRLYTTMVPTSGNAQIIVYGGCNVPTAGKLLNIAASLYANGGASCADALVNGVAPMTNYSIFLNSTFAPGMGVIKFDGSSTTLQNPTKAILNNLQTFTVTGWVYVNAYNPSQSDVYSEGQPAQTLVMQISNAGALSMSAWSTNTPGNWQTYLTSLTVPLKKWTFIAYSLSVGGTRGTFIQYLNGQSQSGAGQPESSGPTSYTGIGYNVGNSVSQNAQYLNGYLANLQIYNSTLTSTQVAQLYRSGIQGAPLKNAGLQAWYPLAGDTNDYSGLGNTAYPLNAIYVPSNYLPLGYLNSYQVSSSGVAMPITNYTTGLTKLYKVNVVAWR